MRFWKFLGLALTAAAPLQAAQDYPAQIKPIVEQRCMVCHGCYDAPCQLKLDAYEGLKRGASKDLVYEGSRIKTAQPSRLHYDAHSVAEWRERGFYPVLSEQEARDSTLYRMLQLKKDHPLPATGVLPDSFDFSLARDQQCPKPEEMATYEQEKPLWGMPYGLPGLPDSEFKTLSNWAASGAQGVARAEPSASQQAAIEDWEAFLNGTSNKEQLMARYIYEHLYYRRPVF